MARKTCLRTLVLLLSLLTGLVLVDSLQAQDQIPEQSVLPMPRATLGPLVEPRPTLDMRELVQISLKNNPQLHQKGFDVSAAHGRAVQAGLYPNPVLSGSFDELGDRTGTGGINTFPYITQEIVTAGKLKLSRAVAERKIDLAYLDMIRQRFELITTVRKGYFKVLEIQQKIKVLEDLRQLSYKAYQAAKKRLQAQDISELEYLQFRVELHRWAAKLEAEERKRLAAWQELTASMGAPHLPLTLLKGSLNAPLPKYDFVKVRELVLKIHPEIQAAKVGISRSELALKRAAVEKYPNVTVGVGYTRQNQNKSDDWSLHVGIPLPVFNRNQGNVWAAQAEVQKAFQGVQRAEYELLQRLAAAFGKFDMARKQASRYRVGILTDSTRAYQMSLLGFEQKEFDYLSLVQAQRTIAEARLEYLEFLSQGWQAASEIAGLMLQENWCGPVMKK